MNASLEGLLTDEQIIELGRIQLGLIKIREAIGRVNSLANESGFSLRAIPDFHLGMMGNDISQLMFSHELAEKRLAAAAFEAVERLAA